MECPICYENIAQCQFVCGHTFCHGCTKVWYRDKGTTCPMCRASVCFKGIIEKKKRWERERMEGVLTDLVEQILTELLETFGDLILHCISFVQERYKFVMRTYPWLTCDDLDYVLRATWLRLKPPGYGVYEPATYTKYLMVSNSEYGVMAR